MRQTKRDSRNSEAAAQRKTRIRLTAVARGAAPADRFIRGGTVVNVYSRELIPANVALLDGRVAYVGASELAIGPTTEVIDASGSYVSPSWIEPHCHPWVLYNPVTMVEGILPGGTTQVFNDNLFFYLLAGPTGFARLIDALADLPLRFHWLVRLVSQSPWRGERKHFASKRIRSLLARPEVAGTAEVTRWNAIFQGDPSILESFEQARRLGKRADGHTAGASYEKLNAIVAGGITACHEAITAQEILDRLRLGLWTLLRHSSLRPEVIRAITREGVDTARLMLTVDGPAPRFIAEGGFIDEALRGAVASGIPPVQAIQMATINPATYYRIDDEFGGIAPGRWADLVILPDLESFRPKCVMVGGRDAAVDGQLKMDLPSVDWDSLGLRPKFSRRLKKHIKHIFRPRQTAEQLPVIEFVSDVITRGGAFRSWDDNGRVPEGFLLCVLADRQGQWITRSWIRGFAPGVAGLATTFNSTTHLLALGRDARAMERAAASVIENSGGLTLADEGHVIWNIALPIAGIMSPLSFGEVVRAQRELDAHVHEAGFPYRDILYALLFLTIDFLPGWRLSSLGVLDARTASLVQPSEKPACFARERRLRGPATST